MLRVWAAALGIALVAGCGSVTRSATDAGPDHAADALGAAGDASAGDASSAGSGGVGGSGGGASGAAGASGAGSAPTDAGADAEAGADAAAAEAACNAWAQTYCSTMKACTGIFGSMWYDMNDCTTLERDACLLSLDATGSARTVGEVTNCAAAMATASCDDLFYRQGPPACAYANGTLPDKAACVTDSQCQSGVCMGTAFNVCGYCEATPQPGASCTGTVCAGGACVGSKCVPWRWLGDACDASHPCEPELACQSGVCVHNGRSGAPCASVDDCDVLQGYFCDTATSTCQKTPLSSAGEPCEHFYQCSAGTLCVSQGDAGPPQCVPEVGPGESCGYAAQRFCRDPYSCAGGLCVERASSVCTP